MANVQSHSPRVQLEPAPDANSIRELRNVLERACMLTEGRILSEREVLAALGTGYRSPEREVRGSARVPDPPPPQPIPVLNREALERALQQVGGNRSAAARLLGISRRAFYRRLETFGLR